MLQLIAFFNLLLLQGCYLFGQIEFQNYLVEELPMINTEQHEYSPAFVFDSLDYLVYTREIEPYESVVLIKDLFDSIRPVDTLRFYSESSIGTAFFVDNLTFYTSCANGSKSPDNCSIYRCEKSLSSGLDSCSQIVMNFGNNRIYNIGHAAYCPKMGLLVFAARGVYSDSMDSDLWWCHWDYESKQFSLPIKFGDDVNSEYDELFPYIDQDGELYYGSNKDSTDFDIYQAVWNNGSWLSGGKLPGPINTEFNDYSLIYSKKFRLGYLTSDRSSGVSGMDIYRVLPPIKERREITFDFNEKINITIAYGIFDGSVLDSIRNQSYLLAQGIWSVERPVLYERKICTQVISRNKN